MLKKRIVALITGITLIVAVAAASADVANSLATTPAGQAVACVPTGGSGGGC